MHPRNEATSPAQQVGQEREARDGLRNQAGRKPGWSDILRPWAKRSQQPGGGRKTCGVALPRPVRALEAGATARGAILAI